MADDGLIDRLRAAFAPQDTQSYAYDPTGYSAPSATPSFLNRYMPAGMFTGDPEAQGSADASQAMSPVVSPYLAKVLSGAMSGDSLKEGLQSVNDAFANHDYPALAGMFAGGGAGIKAYHGSPFDFNAFDASKIGTGEGAQAYGHGLYFAERPETARAYRENLSQGGYQTSDGLVNYEDIHSGMADAAKAAAVLHPDQARQIANYVLDGIDVYGSPQKFLKQYDFPGGQWGDAYRAAANYALDRGTKPNPGRMYEVNIDADPEQFLHWDKPLSEQGSPVKGALRSIAEQIPDWGANKLTGGPTGTLRGLADADALMAGRDAYNAIGQGLHHKAYSDNPLPRWTPDQSYAQWAAQKTDVPQIGPPQVSGALNQAGIPGIRYLDQGSRGAGDGTSNYVVFDPRIVQILKKYGLAGFLPSAGLAAGTGNDQ